MPLLRSLNLFETNNYKYVVPTELEKTKRDTLALPKIWEETKMLKHGDTVMRFLKFAEQDRARNNALDSGKSRFNFSDMNQSWPIHEN